MATLENLEQQLAYLGKEARTIVNRAVLKGAKEMVAPMRAAGRAAIGRGNKSQLSISTGKMVASIGARSVKQSGMIIGSKAGLDVGSMGKGADIDTHHGGGGHLFVSGTDHRYSGTKQKRRGGKYSHTVILRGKSGIVYRGRSPAHMPSFITTAAASSQAAVETVVKTTLDEGIARAINRIG